MRLKNSAQTPALYNNMALNVKHGEQVEKRCKLRKFNFK